ncbi:hypothetical protein LO772_34030 [Yinghuangia sp. ASG 101]|uniref:hypothetical protein n=1 Tax=Yinghuangia sp. ASG 101 TaxID=2896848 RepID=UPI001E282857|nr:hypothetical protein [Yinghuangia sp. ASG 101]UGQ11731.1 hypothetical protein LO772_34030 [Yinghuangia sp. ASG 101]
MFVFVCAGCGAQLTVPLAEVALPVHAHQTYGNGVRLPALMESGTFAVDPEPWGPPWRAWDEIGPDRAAALGIHAPVHAVSEGVPGMVVIAPGDARGTVLIPETRGGYCCGLDGTDGPNMACQACGLRVATRIDDCSLWQAVWLAPDAVRRVPVGGAGDVPLTWAELLSEGTGTPPCEPVAVWGPRRDTTSRWSWSPRWEAAAGRALAHLLAASEGRAVTVPDGLTADVFRRALDALLPPGPQARHAELAGPGRPPAPGTDILLVPTHPQTGAPWSPADPTASTHPVPLPFGVWLWLAFPEPHLPIPSSGILPDGVLRDDPPAPRPDRPFRIDAETFRHTLVRLPAVRRPWLRDIHDDLAHHRRAGLF